MPSITQIADILFKKWMGLGDTQSGRQFFNEPIRGRVFVVNSQIWGQSNQIPNTAPTSSSGIVQYVTEYPLTAVVGTTNSFSGALLQNTIPFNWGDGTSYNYKLYDSTYSQIAFGVNDWTVDTEAGILMFNNGVPPNMPPLITFYRYSGVIGINTGNFITTEQTGNFISSGQLLSASGDLVNTISMYGNSSLPIGCVTSGNLENTFLPYGINLNNEWLIGNNTLPSVDWQNRILSGDWNAQSLTVGGQPITTGGQNITGDFITSAQTGQFYSSANPSGFLTKNNVYSFKTTLISGINSQTISYGQTFVTPPLEVSCTFQNDVDNYVYSYAISSVNTSGFIIGFSDYLSNGGYILNTQINF